MGKCSLAPVVIDEHDRDLIAAASDRLDLRDARRG